MPRRTQYDLWFDTFEPQKNHLDENASYDGYMFETFGKELEYVLSVSRETPNRVWTLVDADNGKLYICSGYHLVNRMGYFITKKPLDEKNPVHYRRYVERSVFAS